MRDSLVASNARDGIFADSFQVYFTIEESSILANLSIGIQTFSGSIVNVGASTIGANGKGVDATQGGSLISFGNNQMSANGANGNFTSIAPLR